MTVNEIWEQVKVLSDEEQEELIRRLLTLHGGAAAHAQIHDILEFEGIGAHLADDEDPQVYISRIRDEWDSA